MGQGFARLVPLRATDVKCRVPPRGPRELGPSEFFPGLATRVKIAPRRIQHCRTGKYFLSSAGIQPFSLTPAIRPD